MKKEKEYLKVRITSTIKFSMSAFDRQDRRG